MNKIKEFKVNEKLSTFLFYASVLIFLVAFNFQDSMTGGWYQQNMPTPLGGQLKDIYFVDSLLGFAVSDSSILRTTNGGDNWAVKLYGHYIFQRIKFFNTYTGYACAGNNNLLKSTNSGENWTALGLPPDLYPQDMFFQSIDTIWAADNNTMVGGIFFTSNGGISWQSRSNGLLAPLPNKLYFYNSRIGFASGFNQSRLFKTTNTGINWVSIPGNNGFNDIVFVDSLTGYKTSDSVRKTTNGGTTWIAQKKPKVNNFDDSFYKFALINKDTIWGVGTSILTIYGTRGILYKTTNGGQNWGYQIPDTININANNYYLIDFLNKNIGWAHHLNNKGIHTTVGGNDTTFYTGINNNITFMSREYVLYQNYPNPFNPISNIKYKIEKTTSVKLIVFDITGKEIKTLVNKKQNSGEYSVIFDGSNLSSGIYFYTLLADGIRIDTKKMILIK